MRNRAVLTTYIAAISEAGIPRIVRFDATEPKRTPIYEPDVTQDLIYNTYAVGSDGTIVCAGNSDTVAVIKGGAVSTARSPFFAYGAAADGSDPGGSFILRSRGGAGSVVARFAPPWMFTSST
jgi:hypothetical protein